MKTFLAFFLILALGGCANLTPSQQAALAQVRAAADRVIASAARGAAAGFTSAAFHSLQGYAK